MLWTLLLLPVLAAATVPMTGPNICTGNAVGGIWRKVIIPYECRTRDGMSNAECAALSTLWTTYFPYCCPYAAGYVPVPGAVQPTMFKGGVGAVPTWLLKLIVRPVSWRGGQCAAKPVGCAVFYDCGSSPCKLACDNMGMGTNCTQRPNVFVDAHICAPTANPANPQPRLGPCKTTSPTTGAPSAYPTTGAPSPYPTTGAPSQYPTTGAPSA